MKFLFKILAAFMAMTAAAHAEELDRYGFVNVVNMIPSNTNIEIQLAEKKLAPNGLKPAVETGWFMVPVGAQPITISHANHKKVSTAIAIHEGVSNLFVIYLEPQARALVDDKPLPPKISIAVIPAYEASGYAIKAISLLPETNHFQVSKETIELEFKKITEIPNWSGGEFQIKHDGKKIGEVGRYRERAAYLLLVSTDHEAKLLTAVVSADAQKLPPWMKK
jgi:hypothetical protein